MNHNLLRLFPSPATVPLRELYLSTPLTHPGASEKPFVYCSFIVSLDGRIAIADPDSGVEQVPESLTNPHDWRLFRELAARADVLITSGRHLRAFAAGEVQDVLDIGVEPEFPDLVRFREKDGLTPRPDIAILSYELNFELPRSLIDQGRRVLVFTSTEAPAARIASLREQGAEVIQPATGENFDGRELVDCLAERGYRRIYSITGPRVLNTLVACGVLDALFLTWRLRLLGGERYVDILSGQLPAPADFELTSLYYDSEVNGEPGQLFARLDRR